MKIPFKTLCVGLTFNTIVKSVLHTNWNVFQTFDILTLVGGSSAPKNVDLNL